MRFNSEEFRVNKKLFRGAILETVLLSLINESGEGGLHGYAVFLRFKKSLVSAWVHPHCTLNLLFWGGKGLSFHLGGLLVERQGNNSR